MTLQCDVSGASSREWKEAAVLQGPERHHRLDALPRDAGNVLEVAVVVKHREVGSLSHGRENQVRCADRAVLAPVGQEQHYLSCAVEVGLMGWNKRESSDEVIVDPMRVVSAEQGFQMEHATQSNLAFLLQVQEPSGNGWMPKASVDAVVQHVGQ